MDDDPYGYKRSRQEWAKGLSQFDQGYELLASMQGGKLRVCCLGAKCVLDRIPCRLPTMFQEDMEFVTPDDEQESVIPHPNWMKDVDMTKEGLFDREAFIGFMEKHPEIFSDADRQKFDDTDCPSSLVGLNDKAKFGFAQIAFVIANFDGFNHSELNEDAA
jgi:hypothetical protein